MKIKLSLFGKFKEDAGREKIILEIPSNISLKEFINFAKKKVPQLKSIPASTMFAINMEYSRLSKRIKNGDEIAFIPPVSGG